MKKAKLATRNRRAVLILVVLGPLIAELAFGITPPHLAFLLLLWLPIYGAGVLLIRELVVRAGGRWPSILLLGVAYELAEDGIGLQALTSPHLYHAADWAPRILGFNTAYWEANVVYHSVFSVAIPILLVELLFPNFNNRPYMGKGGLVLAGLIAALGVGILRITVPLSQDPGYVAPIAYDVGYLVMIAVLATISLRVLPRIQVHKSQTMKSKAPSSAVLGWIGGIATLLFLALIFPFWGSRQSAFTHGDWAFLPLGIAAVLVVWITLAITRWSRYSVWGTREMFALASGALIAHTVVGILGVVHTAFDRVGLFVILVLTIWFLVFVSRRMEAIRSV